MKSKNLIIAGVVILILIIIGGGIFVLSNKKPVKPADTSLQAEEEILGISADQIGLKLTMASNGKSVILQVVKTEDIASVDYQLSYNSKGDVPRGAIGHIDVKTKGQPIKKDIVLGTCSDVCHYDEEVSDIKLILKVTKSDGKIYQAEASLES
ncbi:MAG: hypothetical protein HYT08_01160 [Candidatus Levybacteria bacterium]|nr:hypothetical protein [Candidatus Levybacteria bacterium]